MISTKFNEEFIKKLIRENEGKCLDFKQQITSKEKIAKTLSAFANTEGGILLIGLSDKKQVIGIDPHEEQFMIDAANQEFCFPRVSLSSYPIKWTGTDLTEDSEDEEVYLLLVEVSPSQGPLIYCKSKTGEIKAYRRENDKTILISN